MYQNPTLFPQISNRESWRPIIVVWDDDAAQPIELRDPTLTNSLYTISLEIVPAGPSLPSGAYIPLVGPYYDDCAGDPVVTASLASGAAATSNPQISIIDVGTIQIVLPKQVISALAGNRTYDVYMTVYDPTSDDGRQLFVGRLPIAYGGRTT